MTHEILISKFFNKRLSEEEESQVSLLLKTDANFKVLFKEHENMHLAFKIKEKEVLKNHLQNLEGSISPATTNLYKKIIGLAIACCFMAGVFFFFNKSTISYDNYFEVYPNVYEPIVRGNGSKNYAAFLAYENKNYLKAETHFEAILKNDSDPNIEFYYAMSLLNQNKIQKAHIILNALKSRDYDFIPETYWYLALIAIKENDLKLAKEEITTLVALNSNFKKEDSIKLLNQLK